MVFIFPWGGQVWCPAWALQPFLTGPVFYSCQVCCCPLGTSQFTQKVQPSVLDVASHCQAKQGTPCCRCNCPINIISFLSLQQPSISALYSVCDPFFTAWFFVRAVFGFGVVFCFVIALSIFALDSSLKCKASLIFSLSPPGSDAQSHWGFTGRNLRQGKRCVLGKERAAWKYGDGNRKIRVWWKDIRKRKRKPISL